MRDLVSMDCLTWTTNSAGTMCDEDGELFIKPCTQAEVNFYQNVKWRHRDFAEIVPVFMGTLMLSDPADLSSIEEGVVGPIAAAAANNEQLPPILGETPAEKDNITWVPNKSKKIKTDQAVVLENASFGFKQPNILDVKLGVRLWADDAPLQKKQRFDKITSETTHRDYGFRIAGMRVYRGSDNEEDLDEDDYKIYDKDYGRVEVNNDNILDAMRSFVFNEAAGVDDEVGKAVCAAFARDIRRVEEVLSQNETRMYSASLLFVFEGDGDALRAAIDENNYAVDAAVFENGDKPGRTNARVDSGIGMDDDDFDDDDRPMLPKIYTLKLIDFAHANWVPGQGPDENSLKGVRSLAKIFDDMSR
jgi:inositol-polyphosphate multikinase